MEAERSLAEVEAQDDLAVGVDVAPRHEPEPRVEAGWAALAGLVAGEQLGASVVAHQVDDLAHDLPAIATALVPVADDGGPPGLPAPYAGWDDPSRAGDHSTAIPVRRPGDAGLRGRRGDDGRSVYQSPDLRDPDRDRSSDHDRDADTGPIVYDPVIFDAEKKRRQRDR